MTKLVTQGNKTDKKRLALLGNLATGFVLDVGCHDLLNPHLSNAVGFDLKTPKQIASNYSRFLQGNCQELDK